MFSLLNKFYQLNGLFLASDLRSDASFFWIAAFKLQIWSRFWLPNSILLRVCCFSQAGPMWAPVTNVVVLVLEFHFQNGDTGDCRDEGPLNRRSTYYSNVKVENHNVLLGLVLSCSFWRFPFVLFGVAGFETKKENLRECDLDNTSDQLWTASLCQIQCLFRSLAEALPTLVCLQSVCLTELHHDFQYWVCSYGLWFFKDSCPLCRAEIRCFFSCVFFSLVAFCCWAAL